MRQLRNGAAAEFRSIIFSFHLKHFPGRRQQERNNERFKSESKQTIFFFIIIIISFDH